MSGNLRPAMIAYLVDTVFINGIVSDDDWQESGGVWTLPATFVTNRLHYVGLLKTDGTECSGTGYTRKFVVDWTPDNTPEVVQLRNSAALEWVGQADWGTLGFAALFPTQTGGIEIARTALIAVPVTAGMNLRFPVNSIVFHFD